MIPALSNSTIFVRMKSLRFVVVCAVLACNSAPEKLKELKKSERIVQAKINSLDSSFSINERRVDTENCLPEKRRYCDSLSVKGETGYKIDRVSLLILLDSIQREIAMLSPDSLD